MNRTTILVPPDRLLLGPGPSNPDPRVLAAMAAPVVGHLDPYFLQVLDETMGWLRQVFRTKNHHTIPMSGTGTAGLETILLNLLEPGDETNRRFARHQQAHEYLVGGLKRLGMTLFTPPSHQLPMLHVINIPGGVDDLKVRRALLDRGIEIAGGFGPLKGKTWRVGLMGHNARAEAVDRLLAALGDVLRQQGIK